MLSGPHSACTIGVHIYTITNYNHTNIYNAYTINNNGVQSPPITINGTGQFAGNFVSGGNGSGMVIVQQLTPCTSADTILVQPCCVDPSPNEVGDINSQNIPNMVLGSNYVYNGNIQPQVIVIRGQLEISNTTEFYNCTLNMDEGASILVRSGQQLVLINSIVQAGCNRQWAGIKFENNSLIKMRNNSRIEDAQYAFNITGNVITDFDNSAQLLRNYVGIFSKQNSVGNNWTINNISPTQSLIIDGRNLTSNSTLLAPYFGQNPAPATRSFAGVYMTDVPNFSSIASFSCIMRNLNIGMAFINSNVNIPRSFNFSAIQPSLNGAGAQEYAGTAAFNGSGIYAQAAGTTTASSRTLTVGTSATAFNTFNNCRYGVFANSNMNVDVKQNRFFNMTDIGAVRIDGCPNRLLNIVSNQFGNGAPNNGFKVGVYASRIANATLQIVGNTFNNGPVYYPATESLGNTAIYVTNKVKSFVNGYINYNIITSARIGIYVSNLKGPAASRFNIIGNNILFNRAGNLFVDNSSGSAVTWNHYGIWLSQDENIFTYDNEFNRTAGFAGIPTSFEEMLRGINEEKCSNKMYIQLNHFYNMGTHLKIQGGCNGTFIQCNDFNSDITQPFPRGIYFDFCSLDDQGSQTYPYDNTWNTFNPSSQHISGNLNQALGGGTNPTLDWFYRSGNSIYSIIPFTIPLSFTSHNGALGDGPCNTQQANPPDVISARIYEIVYNQITYDIYPDESRYIDKMYAYDVLTNDDDLRASDQAYQQFVDELVLENIAKFKDAEYLRNIGQIQAAIDRYNSMIDENIIDFNKIYTEKLALEKELDGTAYTSEEIEQLTSIAHMTTWEGGDGVINARNMLNMEVTDNLSLYRLAHSNLTNATNVFGSSEEVKLSTSFEGGMPNTVLIFNEAGQIVFNGLLTDFYAFKKTMQNGIYFSKILLNNNLVSTHKFIVVK